MQYHFEGRLTARDCKRHIPHSFVVPDDYGQMEIRFRFAPYSVHGIPNLLTLTLFDPNGFRGAGHRDGAEHPVRISATEATPGYLRGPLPAGEWIAQIDTHMIMPGETVRYWLDITMGGDAHRQTARQGTPAIHSARTLPRGAGWCRGDLHTHTHHSDATGRVTAELIQMARDQGLDFIFLTDHNTIAGLDEMDALAPDDLLTAGGIELTTFWGHALCLGTREWVDWRIRPDTDEMERIARAIYANDQVFVIAHPQSSGDPGCTGCAWRCGKMMPGTARLVEVWNGPWQCDANNEQALALWYDWLNQGLRLAATAGTDTHGGQDYANQPGFNVVYAETLSESAILRSLRAGRLYLSAGPKIAFAAQGANGTNCMIGETVTQSARFSLTWDNCPADAQIRVIANGRLHSRRTASPHGEMEWEMTPEQAHWLVVEVRGGNGEMLAITNPIFLQTTPCNQTEERRA